jgi:hypothetical protein
MSSEEILGELIDIYFKKCYFGLGDVTQEEEEFIGQHIICIPTDKNGFDSDKEWINKHLEIGKEYTLDSMDVSQSSSTLKLREFPKLSFNTVCFEYKIKRDENRL